MGIYQKEESQQKRIHIIEIDETMSCCRCHVAYILSSHLSSHLSGDYNIDLLKHNVQIPTPEFLDTMFSNSFKPLINKPTRVTSTTATIIDIIFTNQFRGDNNTLLVFY